jgi:hypothetical protein
LGNSRPKQNVNPVSSTQPSHLFGDILGMEN